MSSDINRFLNTLESGRVTRYHAAPTVAPQPLGQHAWGVAILCCHLTNPSAALLRAALLHDAAEIVTGDIPFSVKRSSRAMKDLTSTLEAEAFETVVMAMPLLTREEEAMLKLADTLEGMLWCFKSEIPDGPVARRWVLAFENCLAKFDHVLPDEVLDKARQLRNTYWHTGEV